jgi:hypothetical protein
MKKEQVLGLVRHLLTIGGGIAINRGIADETLVTEIIGGILTFVGIAWSIYSPDKKIGNGY